MTYPPGSPGYPPAQQPTTQFAAPTQQFGKVDTNPPATSPTSNEAPSKLPLYLIAGVAVLGLAVYLSSFGPLFRISGADTFSFSPFLLDFGIVAAVLAGLFAAVNLVPKQVASPALIAVLSVLGFLLVVYNVISAPDGVSVDWGLYLITAFTVLQAIVGVAALLFDSGVLTAPASRPKYEQQQYGQYGGPGQYYGQPQGQPQGQAHHGGQPQHQGPQQRPGYPSQYGGYPSGPATGGFPAVGGQHGQGGTPTPPTGFPTYGQPPQSSNAPTTQVPAQPQSQSPSSSQQSGPTQS